jgi:hypothetical protein
MGVPNGGPNQGPISPSVLKCQNIKMIKWPNDAIEGVNVLKVIPRHTAPRAVGKNSDSSIPKPVTKILAYVLCHD